MILRRLLILLSLSVLPAIAACERPGDVSVDNDVRRVLQRGNGGQPGTLDPAIAEDIHAFNVLTDLYEGLVAQAANGDFVPGVAESWQLGDGGLSYRFTMRQDARWSNGDPVLADDFVRAFRHVASSKTGSAYAFLLEPILNFAEINAGNRRPDDLGVTAVSDRVFEIHLSSPASHWLSVLTMPVTFPSHGSADQSISNGAYTLKERQVGGAIRLRKNPHYWAAASVAIDDVVYLPIVDPIAEYNMYRAGELDITNTIPSESIRSARDSFGNQVRIAPSLALYYLAFDLGEAPLDAHSLRQALTMAVDREQLVTLIGRGERAAYGVVPPGVAAYESAAFHWQDLSKDDREQRARELYALAGYSPANPLSINLVYDAGDIHERVALAVTAMWREVLGVETRLDKKEWKYFLDTRDQRGEWDVMRFAWFGDYNAASTFLDIFRAGNSQNLAGYQSARYDELLAAAARHNDVQAAASLMHDAEAQLIGDYPIAPLYFFVSKHLVKPHVLGFEGNVMDRHPSRYLRLDH